MSNDKENILFIEKNQTADIGVLIKEYEGHSYLHIREYFMKRDGTRMPTKKGIVIRLNQAKELHETLSKVLTDAGVLHEEEVNLDNIENLKQTFTELRDALTKIGL